MPSKKKKYNARFPPARIKKIMQTDEDVGKVAAAVPVIISRALELFIESLILKSNDMTQSRNARTLSTGHIKHIIESEKKFDFLRDLVANMADVQQTEEDGDSPSGLESADPPPAPQPATSRRTSAPADRAEAACANPDKPAKRPRGRPRKHRPEEEQQLPPKKRGRKKKVPKEETTDDSATEDAASNGDSESADETPSPRARVDDEHLRDVNKEGPSSEVPFAQYKDPMADVQTSPLALTVSRPRSDTSPVRGTSPYSRPVDRLEDDYSKGKPLGQEAAQDNLTPSGRPYGHGTDSPGNKDVTSAPVVTHPNLPPQVPTGGLPYPIPAHMGLPPTMNNCSMPPMPSGYPNTLPCPQPPQPMGAPLPPYNLPIPFYGYPPRHLPHHQPHHPQPHPSTEKDDSDS